MKTLIVTLKHEFIVYPDIKINGERLKFKRVGGNLQAQYQTDANEAHITIGKYYELAQKNWFLYALFFWIIGIFGLFTPRYEKKCPSVNYESKFHLGGDAEITFDLQGYKEGNPAFIVTSSPHIPALNNPTNCWRCDQAAEKNAKKYRRLSWFGRLGVLIIAIVIILAVTSGK